jgi:hypothetical protein
LQVSYDGGMYEESIRAEFTHQTESFARNRVATAAETLGVVGDAVGLEPESEQLIPVELEYEDWLVSGEPGQRRLLFRTMLLRWRRP